jgi:predicted small lipoprotein YifL
MLTRTVWRRLPLLLAPAIAVSIAACGSKGDLVLPRAAGGPPPPMTRTQDSTPVPIVPAIPSPPSIPPETAPPAEPKQP